MPPRAPKLHFVRPVQVIQEHRGHLKVTSVFTNKAFKQQHVFVCNWKIKDTEEHEHDAMLEKMLKNTNSTRCSVSTMGSMRSISSSIGSIASIFAVFSVLTMLPMSTVKAVGTADVESMRKDFVLSAPDCFAVSMVKTERPCLNFNSRGWQALPYQHLLPNKKFSTRSQIGGQTGGERRIGVAHVSGIL